MDQPSAESQPYTHAHYAYAKIGGAVIAAQLFETALVPIFEMFKMSIEPDYMEETGGYISPEKFKVHVSWIVSELRKNGNIATDFEADLLRYNDDRNFLVHRLIRTRGVPAQSDAKAWTAIAELAERVAMQAHRLGQQLLGYVLKIQDPAYDKTRVEAVAQMFHRAHLE